MPILALLSLLTGALPTGPVPPDLHGRWRVLAESVAGKPTDPAHYRNLVFEIDAATLRLREGETVLVCTLHGNANIRSLAVTPRTGPRADRPLGALYDLREGVLTICLKREPDRDIPDSLNADDAVLLKLKREP